MKRTILLIVLCSLTACGQKPIPTRFEPIPQIRTFTWRDAKSGMALSFPDDWKVTSGQQPDDVVTLLAPSGRAHAQCRMRIDADKRFLIYPPKFSRRIQHLYFSQNFWDDYLKIYDDDQPYQLLDDKGLGKGFAGYAEAGYTSAVPGPEMPRRGVLFTALYYNKLYVLDCSAHRDAFEYWKRRFLAIAASVDFEPIYNQLKTGNYRDFEKTDQDLNLIRPDGTLEDRY